MPVDLTKYLGLFLSETRERLAAMEKVLVGLDRNPGQGQAAGVDEFFRSAHSIKGMAASMGYQATTALSHALEDLMDPVRSGSAPLTRGTIDLMLAGLDKLRELVDKVEANQGKEEGDAGALVAKIRESRGAAALPPGSTEPAAPAAAPAAVVADGGVTEAVPVDRPAPAASGPTVTVLVEIATTS